MTRYLENFFQGGDQIISLAAVFAVWIALSVIGGAIGGRERIRQIDHLIGWSVVSLILTGGGVLTRIPFTYLTIGAGVLALVSGSVLWRRGDGIGSASWARLLILGLPFFALLSAMRGSQWDEFTDWLVIPRYLLETDAFPSHDNPYANANLLAYPYSWHFITYMVSRLSGRFLENAGAISNVLLLFGFGLLTLRLIGRGLGRENLAHAPTWGLAALAGLSTTLFNPTFAQKVALTTYADTSSAVVTGTAVILGWLMVEALADGDPRLARRYAWQTGAVLLVLINLKQATLVLTVLVIGGIIITALREPRIKGSALATTLPAVIVPPLLIALVWRYHVATEIDAGELRIMPFADWHVALIPDIVGRMLLVLSKKGLYLAVITLVAILGLRGLVRSRSSFDRFALIAAAVVFGYNAFLLFAYVTTFGEFDALRAASYWRYNMHLGLVCVAFAAVGLTEVWRERLAGRSMPRWLAWTPVIISVAAPLVFADKIRFDRVPSIVYFRDVGSEVARIAGLHDRIYIADPKGSGESAAIMRYELGAGTAYGGHLSAYFPDKPTAFQSRAADPSITMILVHSMIPEIQSILNLNLADGRSYLLRRQPGGEWEIVGSWLHP